MLSTKTKTGETIFEKEKLTVKIFSTQKRMGKVAAQDVSDIIKYLLEKKDEINIIFAAAPSQQEFMHYLTMDKSIDWSRINAFHMDEYIGLPENTSQSFGNFLKERLFDKVPFKNVYYINSQSDDLNIECERYSKLLQDNPVDIVCLGIGENGHIAFNDPHVADFNDLKSVKVVELELACRQQQVNENCFSSLDLVPTHALTLTIPTLMKAEFMFCIVPASNKAEAVYRTLSEKIDERCPATILRTKNKAILYLDADSSVLLNK